MIRSYESHFDYAWIQEGEILAESPAAEGVSESDMKKREMYVISPLSFLCFQAHLRAEFLLGLVT